MSLSIKYFVYFITIQMYHHPSSITMYHHLSPFIHCALIKSHRASHFWRLQSHKQITVQELLKSHYITLFRSPFPLTLWLFYIPIGSMYGIYANIGGILMVNVTIYSIHGSYGIYNISIYYRYQLSLSLCTYFSEINTLCESGSPPWCR
jgi:hypothetical protein